MIKNMIIKINLSSTEFSSPFVNGALGGCLVAKFFTDFFICLDGPKALGPTIPGHISHSQVDWIEIGARGGGHHVSSFDN
jgi:hypothetical protein